MYQRSPQVGDCREVHADGDLEEEEGEEGDDGVDVGGARPGCEAADRHRGGDHQQAVLEMVVICNADEDQDDDDDDDDGNL